MSSTGGTTTTRDDGRSRQDLDLFLLALIRERTATIYEFLRDARLSPGATKPALNRLVSGKLVVGSKTGGRESVRYVITPKGARFLSKQWKSLLSDRPKDVDSVVRVLGIATLMRGRFADIASFLDSVIRDRKSRQEPWNIKAKEERTSVQKCAAMKRRLEQTRWDAEQKQLERWRDAFEEKARRKPASPVTE